MNLRGSGAGRALLKQLRRTGRAWEANQFELCSTAAKEIDRLLDVLGRARLAVYAALGGDGQGVDVVEVLAEVDEALDWYDRTPELEDLERPQIVRSPTGVVHAAVRGWAYFEERDSTLGWTACGLTIWLNPGGWQVLSPEGSVHSFTEVGCRRCQRRVPR